MTPEQVIANRRELARREFVAFARQRPLVATPLVWEQPEAGWPGKVWRPALCKPLAAYGLRHVGCVKTFPDGSQLVYLGGELTAGARSIVGAAGGRILLPGEIDWDLDFPPYAAEVTGHLSYHDTVVQQAYGFTGVNSPLSGNAAFVASGGASYGDYFREDGTKCYEKTNGSAGYRWITTAQPPNDQSCQIDFTTSGGYAACYVRASAWAAGGNRNNYAAWFTGAALYAFKEVNNVTTQLATAAYSFAAGVLVCEVVGGDATHAAVVKAYVGASRAAAEANVISGSDGPPASHTSGQCGIAGYGTTANFTMDNICAYIAGTDYVRSVSDALGLTDAATRLVDFARSQTDSEGVLDAVSRLAGYVRAAADNEGLTDAASPVVAYVRDLADQFGISDAADRIVSFARSLADAEGMTDVAARVAAFARSIADAEGLTDLETEALVSGVQAAVIFIILEQQTRS